MPNLSLLHLECVLAQVLPESGDGGAPFTLKELADAAACYSDEAMDYSKVHRAWAALYKKPSTREIVAPLSEKGRTIELSAKGARRVLRHLWKGKIPNKIRNRNPYEPVEKTATAALPARRTVPRSEPTSRRKQNVF